MSTAEQNRVKRQNVLIPQQRAADTITNTKQLTQTQSIFNIPYILCVVYIKLLCYDLYYIADECMYLPPQYAHGILLLAHEFSEFLRECSLFPTETNF